MHFVILTFIRWMAMIRKGKCKGVVCTVVSLYCFAFVYCSVCKQISWPNIEESERTSDDSILYLDMSEQNHLKTTLQASDVISSSKRVVCIVVCCIVVWMYRCIVLRLLSIQTNFVARY